MTRQEFYTKWIETFARDISKGDIEKYVKATGNYLWHIFSWQLLDESQYLSGNDAKIAYDKADKSGALYIKWFEHKQTETITEKLNTADALDRFEEVYVVSKDFKWTYIKTHESMCGPYFLIQK